MMKNMMISKHNRCNSRNQSRRTTLTFTILELNSRFDTMIPPLTEADRVMLIESIKYSSILDPLTIIGAPAVS